MLGHKKLSNLLSKLVLLNSLVILLVILLAGLSVKDYACFLVNSENIVGKELVATLNSFLWKASLVAFIIVGFFHFFTVKKIVRPIKQLSIAAKEIQAGKTPPIIELSSSGEIKELIHNFNTMSQTLHSIEEQRENMLRDIAHELRTPLTNINGYLEALQNNIIDGDPELFGSLLDESRRITRIVELITELNAWDNGIFLEKKFTNVDINNVLTESLTAFQLKLDDEFSEVHFSFDESSIFSNRDGLMQVFTNVLQNIVEYNTGESLDIRGVKGNNTYFITFKHSGQFIDPEKKDLIFERFYRFEESRSTKSYGAGLGLAIAKSIIQAHKGKLGINTDGTYHIFWIELPIGKI